MVADGVQKGCRSALRRRLGLVGAVLLTVGGTAVVTAPRAFAEPECLHASNDFDGDGYADAVIGMPGASKSSGAVQVRITNEGDPYVIEIANPHPKAGARFGTAIAQLSSYVDEGQDALCSQLVVGAPGASGGGSVSVFTFDSDARRFTERVLLRPGVNNVPEGAAGGFGAALGAPFRTADEVDPKPDTLWIGSPDATHITGTRRAGGVTGVKLAPDSDVPLDLHWLEPSGTGATNGRLGAAIAVGNKGNSVYVGAPGYAGGPMARGGLVLRLYPMEGVYRIPYYLKITQNSPNVPGTAEKGDEFGAALAIDAQDGPGYTRLVVGVPGEAVGKAKAAGRVVVLTLDEDATWPEGVLISAGSFIQNQQVVAGSYEAGDRFGEVVWVPRDGKLNSLREYLVGVPGEDVGTLKDSGMVVALGEGRGWTQDSPGVPGTAEAGDRMGASISDGLVGVPGENDGTGGVISGLGGTGPITRFGALKPKAGNEFGAAIG